jgi:DNA polymerase IV
VKKGARTRSILHVDLDPFFVSVERSLDASLRGRPVVVGGQFGGIVAAASVEARVFGVRPGQTLAQARRLCPQAVIRSGDLDAYARISDEVTTVLLSVSRRVERPSADEAYVDLTPESPAAPLPVPAAERVKEELQRRLRLDVSLGLGSSRLAARVASRGARPRGLLVVLPGYEERFLGRQPVSVLEDLPPHLEKALADAGLTTIEQLVAADEAPLASIVGTVAAHRLRQAARCLDEVPIPVAAPPHWTSDEAHIRDRRTDRAALLEVTAGVATRAARRLRPFDIAAGMVTVEIRRRHQAVRRSETLAPAVADEATLQLVAQRLVEPMLEPATGVRAIEVRLTHLRRTSPQTPLFPLERAL